MRHSRDRTLTRIALAAGLIALGGGMARAQYYGGYAPGGYGVNFGQVGFAPVAFGMSSYGYPGAGYALPGYGVGTGYGYNYGYGYGGFGYGGYGGYGYMGMSLADQWMLKYQNYALNASRYNLMNAEASTAYQSANLMHQQALQTALENYSRGKYFNGGGGNVPSTYDRYGSGGGGQADRPTTGDIPFNQLVARDGEVLWPLGAPDEGDLGAKKQKATEAIQRLLREYGDQKSVPVREVVRARRALSDYAVPAARKIKENGSEDYDPWINYVSSLDRGLRSLAGLQGAGEADKKPARPTSIEIKPENSPKSAGDVLKGQIKGNTSPGAEKPK